MDHLFFYAGNRHKTRKNWKVPIVLMIG